MAFTTISTASIAVGKPITQELIQALYDRDQYLYGVVGTIQSLAVPNGSFEIDADGDGVPDNWTLTLFTGGAASVTTSTSLHGEKSMVFTHPGGAGNGGGYLQSDYVEVSTGETYKFKVGWRPTSTSIRAKININWYDDAKVILGTTSTLYDGIDIATAAYSFIEHTTFAVPSSARFAKIKLTGGATENTTAGSIYMDRVDFQSIGQNYTTGGFDIFDAHNSVGSDATTYLRAFRIDRFGSLRFSVYYSRTATQATSGKYAFFRNTTKMSTGVLSTGSTVITADMTVSPDDVVQIMLWPSTGAISASTFSVFNGSQIQTGIRNNFVSTGLTT